MNKLQLIFVFLFLAVSVSSFAQVGIGTNTADASAALDITSTTSGFLPPRMTEAERVLIDAPVAGLIIWCSNCGTKGELQVYNGTEWTHISGVPVQANTDGKDTTTTVVDLVSSATGRTWMDRNLGATQVATSTTDAASYGDLYQWGRAKDGHQSRTSSTTATTATSADPGHGEFIIAGGATDDNWTDFGGEENALWQAGLNDPL